MTDRRIREVYDDYRKGLIPFERVVQAADSYLDRYAQQIADGSTIRKPEGGTPSPQH